MGLKLIASRPRTRENLDDLLAQTEEIRVKALKNVRVYTNKAGDAHEYPDAQYQVALNAIALKAELLGLDKGEKQTDSPQAFPIAQVEKILDELGYSVTKKNG